MNDTIRQLLAAYPVISSYPVLWSDLDIAMHVNNTRYIRWSECGRVDYQLAIDPASLFAADRSYAPVLASITCDFLRSVFFPDTIHIGTRVAEIADDRFVMENLMVSEKQERPVAQARGVLVLVDIQTGRKISLPADYVATVEAFEASRLHTD
ncbi:MAG: hypothetical protein OHK0039_02060 [Bacteroidia bacterium]